MVQSMVQSVVLSKVQSMVQSTGSTLSVASFVRLAGNLVTWFRTVGMTEMK